MAKRLSAVLALSALLSCRSEAPESAVHPIAVRVVTYDPRGRGQSDAVPPGKVSLNHLLLDFETVRQAVGAAQLSVIGWSGGGMETFVDTLRNPNRVTRLVQLAPVAPRFVPYGGVMIADRRARTDSAAAASFNDRQRAGAFGTDTAALCRAADSVSLPPMFANPATRPSTPDVCRFPNEYPARLAHLLRRAPCVDRRLRLAGFTLIRFHSATGDPRGSRQHAAGRERGMGDRAA